MQDQPNHERRIHRVYVTRNTEYHTRKNVCVAVRDRRTGRWIEGHLAIRKRIEGGLKAHQYGMGPSLGEPEPGDRIYFRTAGRDLVTSKVEGIERPEKHVVEAYPR